MIIYYFLLSLVAFIAGGFILPFCRYHFSRYCYKVTVFQYYGMGMRRAVYEAYHFEKDTARAAGQSLMFALDTWTPESYIFEVEKRSKSDYTTFTTYPLRP